MIWYLGFLAFLLGAAIGSFVNACMARIPLMRLSEEERLAFLQQPHVCDSLKAAVWVQSLSPAHPKRSFCFRCGHTLKWYDNLPILSYLFLKGQCRYCGVQYGSQALWVEASHGIAYASFFAIFGISWLTLGLMVVWSVGCFTFFS